MGLAPPTMTSLSSIVYIGGQYLKLGISLIRVWRLHGLHQSTPTLYVERTSWLPGVWVCSFTKWLWHPNGMLYLHVKLIIAKQVRSNRSLFAAISNKWNNMKALIILSHSWSPFFLPTCWYGENELLWGSVWHFYKILLVLYHETWWK